VNRNVGGAVDHRKLAELHKPTDPSEQIQRMHGEGPQASRHRASHKGVHIDIVLRALTGSNRGVHSAQRERGEGRERDDEPRREPSCRA
jgi:hypothetical protein